MILKRFIPFVLFSALAAMGQSYAPYVAPHVTFVDGSGNPCANCTLGSFQAGTTTPTPTFTDCTSGTQNTNPVTLDSAGGASICLATGTSYKFILYSATGGTLWSVDNVVGGFYLTNTFCLITGCTFTGAINGTTASFSGTVTASSFTGAGTGLTGTAASLTAGLATALAGGALGSVPYQSGAGVTAFLASPTTSGHTFVHAWQPSGSAIAPIALDLGTYLASPPAIGGSAAAAGTFTVLQGSTSVQVASGVAMTGNQGNGTSLQHSTGTTTTNDIVKYDANGNAVDSGVQIPATTAIDEYFSFTGCTVAASTDSQCSGSFNLPTAMPDTTYFVTWGVNTLGGSQNIVLTLNQLTLPVTPSVAISYVLTCTFACASTSTPTVYVHAHHN